MTALSANVRNLLLLSEEGTIVNQGLKSALINVGWQIHEVCITNIPDVHMDTMHAGIMVFENHNIEKLLECEMEECLDYPNIKWIAILPKGLESNQELSCLIGESFFDYHYLPVDYNRLTITLGHAHGMGALEKQNRNRQILNLPFDGIIGTSEPINQVKSQLPKLASVNLPVLITGESGTGKEVAAQAIHRLSSRRDKPFITVNCGAIPHGLIQTELFGHEKGSFTGAHSSHTGYFEAANGGTIFLDEVGDLPLELQVVLLRVLQENVVRRVGGTRDIPLDVRVISATNANLQEAVAEKLFREDLFYRLNVFNIHMPSLRDRGEDIILLARYFVKQLSSEFKDGGGKHLTPSALQVLHHHQWPGNVRELINCLQQAYVMSETSSIKPVDLGLGHKKRKRQPIQTLEEARDATEKKVLLSALKQSRNITQLAENLDISRVTVYRLLKKYDLKMPEKRKADEGV